MRIYIKAAYVFLLFVSINGFAQNLNVGCQHSKNLQSSAPIYYSPENLRSDTFDILKYTINLEIGNTLNKQIIGNTQIRFAPKQNNRTFSLNNDDYLILITMIDFITPYELIVDAGFKFKLIPI